MPMTMTNALMPLMTMTMTTSSWLLCRSLMPPVKRRRRARKDRRHTLTGSEPAANGRSEEKARCDKFYEKDGKDDFLKRQTKTETNPKVSQCWSCPAFSQPWGLWRGLNHQVDIVQTIQQIISRSPWTSQQGPPWRLQRSLTWSWPT